MISTDSKLMQEIDKIYHLNQTSEGRINCITDFVTTREVALQARIAELEWCLKNTKSCIDDMAYAIHNDDISAIQACSDVSDAWGNCDVVRVAKALEGVK